MLAKLTSKNQLTLPKAAIEAVAHAEYFQVETRAGTIVLTPVRIQRADAVRGKLAELGLTGQDVTDAVGWARKRVAEPAGTYAARQRARTPAAAATKVTAKPVRPARRRKPSKLGR